MFQGCTPVLSTHTRDRNDTVKQENRSTFKRTTNTSAYAPMPCLTASIRPLMINLPSAPYDEKVSQTDAEINNRTIR